MQNGKNLGNISYCLKINNVYKNEGYQICDVMHDHCCRKMLLSNVVLFLLLISSGRENASYLHQIVFNEIRVFTMHT